MVRPVPNRTFPIEDLHELEETLPPGWTVRGGGDQVWQSGDAGFEAKIVLDGPISRCAVARSGICPTAEAACRSALLAVPAALSLETRIAELRAQQVIEKERALVVAQTLMVEAGIMRVLRHLAPPGFLNTFLDGDHIILARGLTTREKALEKWRQVSSKIKRQEAIHRQRVEEFAAEIRRLLAEANEARAESLRGTL